MVGVENDPDHEGLLPRICKELFDLSQELMAEDASLSIKVCNLRSRGSPLSISILPLAHSLLTRFYAHQEGGKGVFSLSAAGDSGAMLQTSNSWFACVQIQVSFVEVYNEKIRDLLQFEHSGHPAVCLSCVHIPSSRLLFSLAFSRP